MSTYLPHFPSVCVCVSFLTVGYMHNIPQTFLGASPTYMGIFSTVKHRPQCNCSHNLFRFIIISFIHLLWLS